MAAGTVPASDHEARAELFVNIGPLSFEVPANFLLILAQGQVLAPPLVVRDFATVARVCWMEAEVNWSITDAFR